MLDIVRDPTRTKFGAENLKAAIEMLSRAGLAQPTASILVCETVVTEVRANLDRVQLEGHQSLEKLDEQISRAIGLITALALTPLAPLELANSGFSAEARRIAERMADEATMVVDEDDSAVRAMRRVSRGTAPASRAKQSAKDCLIVETYLRVATELRGAGFRPNVVFLSSNTADFTSGARSELHPDLQGDFDAVQMVLATSYRMALHML